MSDELPDADDGESNSGPPGGSGSTFTGGREPAVSQTLTEMFDLLRVARRRYLLYHLYGLEAAGTTYDDAVDAIERYEALERGRADADDVPSRESIRCDLYHVQLPRLEEAGVVECDHRQEYIRFRGYDGLEEWVDRTRRVELD